ncbi:MAG: PIN domain-containing protein [Alteraurantiacibacter sp.]
MYLLDTGLLVELREARRSAGNQALIAWAERVPAAQMFISAATLLELESFAAQAARHSKEIGLTWRDWLDRQICTAFAERILPVDVAVVRRRFQISYADDREGILAATALVHNLTFVTAEPQKYRAGRVKVLGPAGLELDGAEDTDWRGATHSGTAWFRNLLIR